MSSQSNRQNIEDFIFGYLEGADAAAGAVCMLSSNSGGVPKFSSVLGAGALPTAKAPLFILNGKSSNGGLATAGDKVRAQTRGLVRGIVYPGASPTAGLTTLVYYGDGGSLELVPSALGVWPLGYVVSVNVGLGTYDAWFDGATPWGADGSAFLDEGTAGAVCANLSAAVAGNTMTITSGGTPVVYEFTNTGIVTPGHVAVDIATMDAVLPGIITASQSELVAYCSTKYLRVAVKLAAAVRMGHTLTIASTGGAASATAVVAVAAKRLSVQHIKVELTAISLVTGVVVPRPPGGTIRAFWSSMWVDGKVVAPPDVQAVSISSDLVFFPLSGSAGSHVDIFLLLEY